MLKQLDQELAEQIGIDLQENRFLATQEDVVSLGSILQCPDCGHQYQLEDKDVIRVFLPDSKRYVSLMRIKTPEEQVYV